MEDLTMYIKSDEFNSLFVENRRLSITEDSLLNLDGEILDDIISNCITNKTYASQRYLDNIMGDNAIQLIVKAILIDEHQQGIYLVHEKDKNKITIPGGHMSVQDLEFATSNIDLVDINLARELGEEYNSVITYQRHLQENKACTLNILNAIGFTPITALPAMYLYNPSYLNTLTIYFPIIVSEPIKEGEYNSEWVDKMMYKSLQRKGLLEDRYYRGTDNDIRFNKYSFILDFIFNTPLLF